MTKPLIVKILVDSEPSHAFRLWTDDINRRWPSEHTVSGDRSARVTLERGVGGRIFELTSDGSVHVWGYVTDWSPPYGLSYTWHLGSKPADATTVTVTFTQNADRTLVRIEHLGWEHFGDDGSPRRDANRAGWEHLLPYLSAHIEKSHQKARP